MVLDWFGILSILNMVLAFMVAIHLLMDNRSPSTTLAWLLVLSFLPYVGIVIYFFFGENTRKKRIISKKSLDQLSRRSMLSYVEQKDLNVPDDTQTLTRLFFNQNYALPFRNNQVEVFTSGYEFIAALLQTIGRAQSHIHLTTYIFEDDPLGRLVADALIEKARQGVEVRVIYDAVGNWRVPSRFFERLREEGVDTHAFMPVRFPAFTRRINYRNHRKICVVDGHTGFIGGMNIALRYVKGQNGTPWRDTHLMIKGSGVYGLQCAFLVDWYFVDGTLISNKNYYPAMPWHPGNNCIAQVVTSSPLSPWPEMMQGYTKVILQARRYVYIETPYFLPTEPVLTALQTSAQAGVDVRLMIPYEPDSRIVGLAGRSCVSEAAEAGVKVYYYKEGFNHSKLLVVDDKLCSCGSTNVDFRSFENNFEANVFFYDEALTVRMRKVFEDDITRCMGDDEVIDDPSFLSRITASVARLFSPLL